MLMLQPIVGMERNVLSVRIERILHCFRQWVEQLELRSVLIMNGMELVVGVLFPDSLTNLIIQGHFSKQQPIYH